MRKVLWLLWLALVVPYAVAQAPAGRPAFDSATLSPPGNLLSNPSFEAEANGRPLSFDCVALPQYLSLTGEGALHGTRSLLADVPAGTTSETVARQDAPACVGCTYEFSAWVKIIEDRGGQARLVLQMRGADAAVLAQEQARLGGASGEWRRMAVRLKAPPDTTLVRVCAPSVLGGMKVQYDALRLALVDGPRRRIVRPVAQRLEATRTEATWAVLRWLGPPGTYEIAYRETARPKDAWVTFGGLDTGTYSAVGLQPQTAYDFKVRFVWPQHYDELGQAVPTPLEPPASLPLQLTTAPYAPRTVGSLRLWPSMHLKTFPGGQTTPRIVTWKDALYVVEAHDQAIHLSRVKPSDLSIEWTRQLIPRRANPPVVQRVTDACVFADKLYVMVHLRPATGGTADAREMIYEYDLQQGKQAAEPLVITAAAPGGGTWGGGLQVYRQELWALWAEAADQQGQRLTRLSLAPVTANTLGEVHVWQDAPSTLLRSPSLGLFADELLVIFSDLAPSLQRPGYEPLSLVHFNGVSFHGLRKLANLGRNSDGRGAQLGGSFYLLHSTDAPWGSYGGRYRDLRLTALQPDGLALETITYLDDMKCNVSPSATAYKNSLYVVHEKLERAPSDPANPPWSYGTFIGRIDVGQPAPEATP